MKKAILTAALLSGFALSACAAGDLAPAATKSDDAKIPAPLQMAVMGGMKVEKSFSAAGGLTGWILSQGVGNNMVVYTSANGEVAIAGNMLDAKGQNLSKQYLEQYAPKPDYDKMWGQLEKSSYLIEGPSNKDAKSVIYVFKDPNCGYCHLAWKALQAYEKVGLQVRWVPVAFLAADSYDKAAALMSAKDSTTAIREMHQAWGTKLSVPAATKEQRAQLDANNKLMNEWGFRGTPATLYKDKAGKVRAAPGMFPLSDLPSITGLPEQPQSDPSLAKYR